MNQTKFMQGGWETCKTGEHGGINEMREQATEGCDVAHIKWQTYIYVHTEFIWEDVQVGKPGLQLKHI